MAIFTRHDIKNDAIVTDHIVDGAVTLAKTTGVASATDVARMSCYPAITVGTESGNAIAITIQLKDENGDNVARTQAYYLLWGASEVQVTLTAATTGTLLGPGVVTIGISNSSGLLVLTLTDGSGVWAGSGSLFVAPITYGATFAPAFPSLAVVTFA